MSAHERIPDELKSVESAISALRPTVSRIDRDRLMYELGRQAVADPTTENRVAIPMRGRLAQRAWVAAALLFAGLSLALGARLVLERSAGDARDLSEQLVQQTLAEQDQAPITDAKTTSTSEIAPRARLSADERWMMAIASPNGRAHEALFLRPRRNQLRLEPSAPIVATLGTSQRTDGQAAVEERSRSTPMSLRWNDRDQWQELIDSVH